MSGSENDVKSSEAFLEGDSHETLMTYDATGKVPRIVILVWTIALIGFAAYMARYCFPDLALWGRP